MQSHQFLVAQLPQSFDAGSWIKTDVLQWSFSKNQKLAEMQIKVAPLSPLNNLA
ncbi:hypothetical protein [Escherichia coli]|uniref:hypothetical protein n=1 Tax=Escherichia coli TaxID=562 RepID=UPI000DA4EAE8|nr:hypothetical protein [Escherichia coli]EHD2967489.1 hypothetical protein [Escherichia coli]SQJ34294.1 Uncharacterised protein [Escherichia coli]SQJ65886.1 Uncharacterised protein [Escherichia coli]HCJ5986982.1 hypothetical protein [Escherichia coli]HCO5073062.1 hypothetical protein [Escherichia coli]